MAYYVINQNTPPFLESFHQTSHITSSIKIHHLSWNHFIKLLGLGHIEIIWRNWQWMPNIWRQILLLVYRRALWTSEACTSSKKAQWLLPNSKAPGLPSTNCQGLQVIAITMSQKKRCQHSVSVKGSTRK